MCARLAYLKGMKHLSIPALAAALLSVLVTANTLHAASKAELDQLFAAMRTEELLKIMSDEGIAEGDELREDMFGGQGDIGWGGALMTIYGQDRMIAEFRETFDSELATSDITPLLDFYSTDTGQRVARFEIEGRRAISDETVEAAAQQAHAALSDENSARLDQLNAFIAQNDLIELNVAGAMTSNLAFFQGMATGGGLDIGESEMLAMVWEREEEIRTDTTGWVGAYLTFAYDRLSDDDLAEYIALSDTKAGRDLNRALFAGFFEVFKRISYDLGAATARFQQSDEL